MSNDRYAFFFFAGQRKRSKKKGQPETFAETISDALRSFSKLGLGWSNGSGFRTSTLYPSAERGVILNETMKRAWSQLPMLWIFQGNVDHQYREE